MLNHVNQLDFGPLLEALLAQTILFFFTDAPAQTVECDIRFNSTKSWYTGTGMPPGEQYDWWSVVAHEMGHCLGLEVEPKVLPPTVEYPALGSGDVRRQLAADDIAGRNAIYGPPGTARSATAALATSGGGGCSLQPGAPAGPPALLALVGNLGVPLLALIVLRCGIRRPPRRAAPPSAHRARRYRR
jgi:hypothetical protein